VSAKSGTAQVGVSKAHVNSWITGYFPSQNPQYAFAIVMEAGVANNEVGASLIMREVLDWMEANRPGYFQQ
jgi:cell division protein FtsI/penicillin-binding protein 2